MIRFYGIDKPAIGRAGRRVCYREDDAGPYRELADNLVVFDWGKIEVAGGRHLPRAGSNELALALCLAAVPERMARSVYMRFRMRVVDDMPPNWRITEGYIRRMIESIEQDGEAAKRDIARAQQERPPMMTDAGGVSTLGSAIVWDTTLDGQPIAPKDPEDFAWQPAPKRTGR